MKINELNEYIKKLNNQLHNSSLTIEEKKEIEQILLWLCELRDRRTGIIDFKDDM